MDDRLSQRQIAELKKTQGNQFFARDDLKSAISSYSEAINICSSVPTFYTNRALCYKKLSDWERVESDCKKALDLDRESLKGHYMLGLVHLNKNRFPEAIRELEKALSLAHQSKGSTMVEEIWAELAKAKFASWQVDSTVRKEKQSRLREYLQGLMKADNEFQRKKLRESVHPNNSTHSESPPVFELFGRLPSFLFPSQNGENGTTIDNRAVEQEVEESPPVDDNTDDAVKEVITEYANTFENVFEAAEAPDRPTEVPDHLCCPITMDILRDPVITPAGITYERSVLLQHLKRGKKFDPVTRLPMDESQIFPNLALREAVQHFLDSHGWAYLSNL